MRGRIANDNTYGQIQWGDIKHTHVCSRQILCAYTKKKPIVPNMNFVWRISDKKQVRYCMWLTFLRLFFLYLFFLLLSSWNLSENRKGIIEMWWWQVFVCVGWISKTFSTSSSSFSLSQLKVVVSSESLTK